MFDCSVKDMLKMSQFFLKVNLVIACILGVIYIFSDGDFDLYNFIIVVAILVIIYVVGMFWIAFCHMMCDIAEIKNKLSQNDKRVSNQKAKEH